MNRMNPYELPNNRVIYNYRYFLPYAPEWGTEVYCEKRLEELLSFCRDAQIDAVQFYVNTLPGTYYMPAHNAAEQEHWAQWMKQRVAPILRAMGISYQINFQMILGATSYGLDMRDEYDWEYLVNQHGQETLGCACPLSPVFRKQMGEMLRLWAGTEADVIWIDDDFRLHNHGLANGELDYYCYCRRHLDEFAHYYGKEYRREELVAEILRPGNPSLVRQAWLNFLGQSMAQTADWIRQQVHAISPRTRLAQMISSPDVHAAEGRDWKTFLNALCGRYSPMVRPCSGIYAGTMVPLKDQTITFRMMSQSITTIEQVLGPKAVDYGPELENTRFTTWSKSIGNTEYVLVLGQLLGCPQITLSMNDLEGTAIADEPTTVPVLGNNKARLQTLADLELRDWQSHGIAFLCDPASALKIQVNSHARLQDLGLVRNWEDALLQMGIPARYVSPTEAAISPDVVILEKYTAWSPSDKDLEKILSGAVLVDGEAADILQQRGFGELLGVTVGPTQSYGIMAEIFQENIVPGLGPQRIPHRGTKWQKLTLNGAQRISKFVDAKNHHYVGSTLFENQKGGRVVVYAANGDCTPQGLFANHARLRWLHGVLRWLSHEQFCALPILPHYGLTIVRSKDDEVLIAFANLGTDCLNELNMRLPLSEPLEYVRTLDPSGDWRDTRCSCQVADSPGLYNLKIPCHLNAFDWLVLRRKEMTRKK